MSLETRFTRIALRRPVATLIAAFLLAALAIGVIVSRGRIDSNVLNLLPQKFDSVQALKLYDQAFSQANEVTFALWDEKGETDLDGFSEHFGEALRREPWVVRVMDRSPMETETGVAEIQLLAVPLLLNLPPEAFAAALKNLAPEALTTRLARKRAEIEAGSPRAEMELQFDPLGVVVPAMKPLASSFSPDAGRPLASPDGTLRVAIAVTNQNGLDADTCQAMMRQVDDFVTRVRASWEGQAPEVLVTGRTAYVAEMSLGMKDDILWTVAGSVIFISGIFSLAFRRLRPLLAIFVVLALCCLGAVASGVLIFGELNVITMGVCAIMIGISVDFGMIFYGTYQTLRTQGVPHEQAALETVKLLGRGIFFGAATAACAFATLLLSESPGFIQLGTLIGLGVMLSAGLMMTLFFVLVGGAHRASGPDFIFIATRHYLDRLCRNPKPALLFGVAALALLNLYAYGPVGKITVESDPKSLEPAGSRAGFALRTITGKLPAAGVEPVLAFIQSKDAGAFYRQWHAARERWEQAQAKGLIGKATTPAAFVPDPARVEANLRQLHGVDFGAAREAFARGLEHEGFARESFEPAFGLLGSLETLSRGDLTPIDWRKTLPTSSSWVFVLDRFLSTTPNVGVAYLFPNKTLASAQEQAQLREAALGEGVEAHLTGWSYVMADLIPWAKTRLVMLSALMLGVITLVLAFLYRAVVPLLVLLGSLALSVGMMIAGLKLTGIPLNLFNVLGFPLVLGIGVDYGIYTVLAVRSREGAAELATVIKPIFLSGVMTIAGFGSLMLATHPALKSLGLVCALGVSCCLFSTFFFVLPAYLWRRGR